MFVYPNSQLERLINLTTIISFSGVKESHNEYNVTQTLYF